LKQPTIVLAGLALLVRLSAGHLQSRRCEKYKAKNDQKRLVFRLVFDSFADASSHDIQPV
jgi:hypothetical protein